VTPEDNQRYQRQITCWRAEVAQLGKRLDVALWQDEMVLISTLVKDLKVRVRRTCDDLKIPTTGTESLDKLVGKVMKAVE
jgi:hypothetical protein